MDSNALFYSLIYIFICVCFLAPPTEFVSSGLTIQNLLSNFLGSEDLNFIYYHIRRTSVTVVIHSFLLLGYYIGLAVCAPELKLFYINTLPTLWQIYLLVAVIVPIITCITAFYWSRNKWNYHPIANELRFLSSDGNWRSVASAIDIEFRRIDKFTTGSFGRRVIVTDSWVMKTSTYYVHVARQSDIHLTLSHSEEHAISYENNLTAQFLSILVSGINPNLKPFYIRLNALEYGDLKEKLHLPVRNVRSIVIQQSLSDKFIEAFRQQVSENAVYTLPSDMEVDNCIGCMIKLSNVKLRKQCDDLSNGECQQCYCRPMWCLECMGKWFASRQNQQEPETWLGSISPCPTCRAKFCVLDVCPIMGSNL
ncbi:E3 ubiquitin-protein ligase TM129 isoform X2 [Patella vulgata]|uniref:E3 ubiquitin-protein ligase TM129 isoform X2 n=1 Tax=Patella vulgata TaxID=6465 RepID=UPI00217F9D80|nr:E3 ubiquitin-protein ligase TM129 isoform X2 [Patella vulgata]